MDFDLFALVSEISELFRASVQLKQLELITNIHKDVPQYMHLDSKRLQQILVNVVGNAVKFTAVGFVRLEVSVNAARSDLMIEVSDSGIGIDANKIATIFDQFTQANTSISRVHGGTGLGLSISDQLCKLMGGSITVASQFGTGTQFTISIPVQPAKKQAELVPIRKNSQFAGELLLVEDNAVNLLLTKRIFTKFGFTVTTADNGQQALDKFRQSHFDVIFMDIQMPIMDGITATQRIRAMEHPNNAVPIIALSAAAGDCIKDACAGSGMQGFVMKPFTTPQLVKELKKVMQPTKNSDHLTEQA
jgi:CheY-like chemotaxis protein